MNPSIARNRRAKAAQSRVSGSEDRNGRHSRQQSSHQQNVGDNEREWSMIGGSVLAVCGLLRGSISGLALAAVGGALIWRGHTGHCEMYHMLGYDSTEDSFAGNKANNGGTVDHAEHQNLHDEESHAGGQASRPDS
jgi:hypothetical protein